MVSKFRTFQEGTYSRFNYYGLEAATALEASTFRTIARLKVTVSTGLASFVQSAQLVENFSWGRGW